MSRAPIGTSSVSRELGYPVRAEDDGRYAVGAGSEPGDRCGAHRRQVEPVREASIRSARAQRAPLGRRRGAASRTRSSACSSRRKVNETDEVTSAEKASGRAQARLVTQANAQDRFKPRQGKVTAGNSSPITDGASAVLIISEEKAVELGLRPRARFHAFALAGWTPRDADRADPGHEIGARAGEDDLDDIDSVEVNEAFASVVSGLGEGARGPTWQGQRQRWRDRSRPPARRLRQQADGHPAQRPRAQRRPIRPADHVRGRGDGERHDHRTPGLTPRRRSGRPPATGRGALSALTGRRCSPALPGQRYRVAITKPAKMMTSPAIRYQTDTAPGSTGM